MDLIQIVLLSLVQGITEFLPISSSAHLILVNRWFGYADEGLVFDVAAHLGSLCAVIVYFRDDLKRLLTGEMLASLDGAEGHRVLLWLVLATLPIAIIGMSFADVIETHLRSTLVIAVATIVFGLALGIADRRHDRRSQLTLGTALLMGAAQCLALIPGASRAGVTITAGRFCGLARTQAARFSFLMAIPAVGAAGAFGLREMLEDRAGIHWGEFALAVSVSGLAAYACIALFLKLIDRIGMLPFVVYRLALGAVLLAVAV